MKDKILKGLRAFLAYQYQHHFWLWLATIAALLEHWALAAIWLVIAFYAKLDDIRMAVERVGLTVNIKEAVIVQEKRDPAANVETATPVEA